MPDMGWRRTGRKKPPAGPQCHFYSHPAATDARCRCRRHSKWVKSLCEKKQDWNLMYYYYDDAYSKRSWSTKWCCMNNLHFKMLLLEEKPGSKLLKSISSSRLCIIAVVVGWRKLILFWLLLRIAAKLASRLLAFFAHIDLSSWMLWGVYELTVRGKGSSRTKWRLWRQFEEDYLSLRSCSTVIIIGGELSS